MDPRQARFRLFDSVTSFLSETAASQPLVIVLDDLHWADQSTLDLLEFVARDISSNPMLLIGGYRDMELSRQHPLSETLAALTRVRGFQRIPLRGLESSDVGRLVEAVGEIRPSRKLVEDIHDRTEGNPFFVAELTRDLSRGAAGRGGEFDAMGLRILDIVCPAIHRRRVGPSAGHPIYLPKSQCGQFALPSPVHQITLFHQAGVNRLTSILCRLCVFPPNGEGMTFY